MNLRPLNRRERVLATLTATVVALGGLYIYVLEPLTARWLSVRAEAREVAGEYWRLRTLMDNRDRIETTFREYSGAVKTARSIEALNVEMLREVEQLAGRTNMRVTSIKPLSRSSAGELERVQVEMGARGTAHDFVRLLQRLQEPEHLIRVESIQLTVGQDQPPVTAVLSLSKLVRVEG